MRCEPQIEVTCDNCNTSEYVGLTALAGGSYDERNVDGDLTRMGWTVAKSGDLCPDCSAEEGEQS